MVAAAVQDTFEDELPPGPPGPPEPPSGGAPLPEPLGGSPGAPDPSPGASGMSDELLSALSSSLAAVADSAAVVNDPLAHPTAPTVPRTSARLSAVAGIIFLAKLFFFITIAYLSFFR